MSIELSKGREQLTAVVQASRDTITVETTARALGVSRTQASKTLSRWRKQGWLRRVARGIYVPASIDTLNKSDVLSDPWVLVPSLFGEESYVGARTAAEYWDLTEQLFRDIVVFTVLPVRRRSTELQGATFTAVHVMPISLFGTKIIWRGQTKMRISDVHRTLIDMLLLPDLGGGMQHVGDCLRRYLGRKDADLRTVITYGDRLGNSVLFKRLGFLLERIPHNEVVVAQCLARVKSGLSPLDPTQKITRIDSKWNLRVPRSWRD